MTWHFWVFWLPMLLGIIGTVLMVRTFSNLNLPAAILILLGSLVPTFGYVTPIVYLCWLLGDDCENVRDDTELGKFINKWYYF